MKTLIAEDDFVSRLLLQEILNPYGETHAAVNGREAVEAVQRALEGQDPYALICLDILMPEMDGQEALQKIRDLEAEHGLVGSLGAKIIMISALDDIKNVANAYYRLCDDYCVKPLDKDAFLDKLRELDLIQ